MDRKATTVTTGSTVLVMGSNPAWQKTLRFSTLVPGAVNRADAKQEYASGKGINFARATDRYGVGHAWLVQFAGGANGDRLEEELRRENLRFHSVRTVGETRCCITCRDVVSGETTELIEPSEPVPAAGAQAMLDFLREHAPAAAGLAISGTLPDGTDPALYVEAVALADRHHLPVLIDAWRDIAAALDHAAALVVKINREELCRLTGCAETTAALCAFRQRWGRHRLGLTDGPQPAYYWDGIDFWQYQIPPLTDLINPIGAGDTASAVFFAELLRGGDGPEPFRTALAAASANCQSPYGGDFDQDLMRRLRTNLTFSVWQPE